MKVSAIIPFYNVEPFIERCSRSLLSQTLDDTEFIFVDDGSPDGSRAVLEKVIDEHPDRNVRIITHEVNKGLPAARNTGFEAASGDFIYHCDSDDYLEPEMLEKMYDAAIAGDADFVYCDYYLSFSEKERLIRNPSYENPLDLLRNGFLSGAAKYNVWNKLVKRSLYQDNGISFPAGHSMGEDMTMLMLSCKARRMAFVQEGLYHYVQTNDGAFTKTVSERHLEDVKFNVDRITNFLSGAIGPDESDFISFFKLNVKLPFLFSKDKHQRLLWREWYPEANGCIFKNKYLPLRTKMVQWFAAKNQFWAVSLYSSLVDCLFYGLLFKK